MVLYENTIRNFKESIFHGRLSGFLEEEYEQITEQRPDPLMKVQWKYMVRLIYEYLAVGTYAGEINENCGIRIDLCLSSLQTSVMIVLASMNRGHENVTVMDMLPWESVRLSDEEDMVIYSDDTGEHEVIHPSYQVIEYSKYLSKGQADENLTFRQFAYLHECEQLRETDIENNYRQDIIARAPIVYAGDTEEFYALTGETLAGGDGLKVLKHLHMLEELTITDSTGGLFDDQKYIYSVVHRYLSVNKPAWILVKNPPGSGGSRLIKHLEKSAENLPGKLTVIEKGDEAVPENFGSDDVTVWFYDEYEDPELIDRAKMLGADAGIPVHMFTLHVPSLKYNSGSGLPYLAGLLGLGTDETTDWDPELYTIHVAENKGDVSKNPKIADITFGKELRMDPQTGKIIGRRADKRNLYNKLSKGSKGVNLHIEDEALREFVKKKIDEAEARSRWIRNYSKSFGSTLLSGEENAGAEGGTGTVAAGSLPAEVAPEADAITKKCTEKLISYMGGRAWKMMTDESRTWTISGVVAYYEMKGYDQLLDFSGVCVQICKAFESEMAVRLFSGFRDWLIEKYGKDAAKKAPYDMLEGKKAGSRFVEPERISLGQYEYIIGMDHKGRVTNGYAWKQFSAYASEKLLMNGLNPAVTMKEHLTYIEKVRTEYRNQAAHTESIDVTIARSCIDYVVGSLHRLGVMLDDYKF